MPEYINVPKIFLNTGPVGFNDQFPVVASASYDAVEIPCSLTLTSTDDVVHWTRTFTVKFWYDGKKQGYKYAFALEALHHIDDDEVGDTLYKGFLHMFMQQFGDVHEAVLECWKKRLAVVLGLDSGVPFKDMDSDTEEEWLAVPPSVSTISRNLPAMDARVEYPCACHEITRRKGALWDVIQHLNDYHDNWTREKVADWVDELHEAGIINAEFAPWEDVDSTPDMPYTPEVAVTFNADFSQMNEQLNELSLGFDNLSEAAKANAEAFEKLAADITFDNLKETLKNLKEQNNDNGKD